MKKGTSKILSALLIATLVFTSAGVAFADSGESGAADSIKSNTAKASAVEQDTLKVADQLKASVKEAGEGIQNSGKATTKSTSTFNLTKMVTGNETPGVTELHYSSADTAFTGNYRGVSSQPITLSKGTVLMAASALGYDKSGAAVTSGSVYFGVYKDAALTQPVESYSSVSADGSSVRDKAFKISASGTYYLGVYSYITGSTTVQAYEVIVGAAYINGADRTVTNGQTIAVGQKDEQTNYFKFKATKTGYLTITESENYNKVALCNSSKKALSGYTYARYAPTYGVKKGTTYYIKAYAGSNSDGGYQMKIKNNAISEKSGTKKSKAVAVKKNTTKKGTITAGSSQADWYKFTVTSKKTVKITINGKTNDTLKAVVYKGSKNIGSGSFSYSKSGLTLTSVGKLSKGTYYIKIYRGNSKSSGWYSLKWK